MGRGSFITVMILFISFLLVGITVASVITDTTSDVTTDSTSDYDLDQITNDVVDEITSYIQIKDQKGKFSEINGEKRITKIALLVSPLVSQNIDLTQMTIQLDNGESVRILNYIDSKNLDSNSIFDHFLWDNLTGNDFGFISITDLDNSIADLDSFNENSDNAYLIFKLPSDMEMKKYNKMIVTLLPSSGITIHTLLKAPMPMSSVITFE